MEGGSDIVNAPGSKSRKVALSFLIPEQPYHFYFSVGVRLSDILQPTVSPPFGSKMQTLCHQKLRSEFFPGPLTSAVVIVPRKKTKSKIKRVEKCWNSQYSCSTTFSYNSCFVWISILRLWALVTNNEQDVNQRPQGQISAAYNDISPAPDPSRRIS